MAILVALLLLAFIRTSPQEPCTQGGYPLAVAPIDAATVDTAYLDLRRSRLRSVTSQSRERPRAGCAAHSRVSGRGERRFTSPATLFRL